MDILSKPKRLETTQPKTVWLTGPGQARIQAWADANDLNFSAAIETLALLGLDDERNDHIIPALRATTLQGIRLAFNRLARLLSDIATEAALARTMSEGVMLQLIREVAADHPDDFEAVMSVRRDSRRAADVRIRRFHEEIKASMKEEALQRLRNPVARAQEVLGEEEDV
jgi:hypothetical protein